MAERRELLEDFDVRRGSGLRALLHGQLESLEQHGAELRRGIDVEFDLRGPMDGPLELAELRRELAGEGRQQLPVHEHTRPLHVDQHREQRNLDPLEEGTELVVLQLGGERVPQAQHGLAVVTAVAPRGRHRDGGERALGPALPRQVRIGAQLGPEDFPSEVVQGVGAAPRVEDEAGEHRVVGDAGELHACTPQHDPVVLDVVPRLGDGGVGEELAQRGERRTPEGRKVFRRGVAGKLTGGGHVGERQVPRASRGDGQGEPDDLAAHGVEGRRLDVQCDD